MRSSGGIAFHLAVGETFELFDHFVETAGADSARTPLTSQILRFAQTLADLGGKLAIVAPVAAYRAAAIDPAALPVSV
jgi:hypothetical protein